MAHKLYEILGVSNKKADLGIEVEVELAKAYTSSPGWEDKEDHSLRGNSREYVTLPIKYEEADALVKSLKQTLKQDGQAIIYTYRAGVHIHLNALGMTVEEIQKLVMLYYIVEVPLIDFCGEDRVGNAFCLRGIDAEGAIQTFKKFLKNGRHDYLNNDNIRYGALNFKALATYGTLEFRSLATQPDLAGLEEWISILRCLKDKSFLFENPRAILEKFSALGPEDFCKDLLGDNYPVVFAKGFNPWEIYAGLDLAQDICYYNV